MILAYNHERFVRQAVEGALMQQCSYPFEIVVCDDCSTDNTREVCLNLQKEYPGKIRLLLNERNKGVINNYFDVMRQCRGKYIADCAADDYWTDPLKLQKQADILEQREDVVLVFSDWKDLFEKTGKIMDRTNSPRLRFKKKIMDITDIPAFLNSVGNTSMLNINMCCFRREAALAVFEEYNRLFDAGKYPCEDCQLLCLLLCRGLFYYIDEELGVYRNDNASASRAENFTAQFIYQYKRAMLKLELISMFQVEAKDYLSIQSYWLITAAFKAKRSDYAEQSKVLMQSHGYRWGLKTELLYRITVNRFLLYPAHWLFLLLRRVKRLFP
jgi:glycosyltransferase involved in cell wall biosynthesis